MFCFHGYWITLPSENCKFTYRHVKDALFATAGEKFVQVSFAFFFGSSVKWAQENTIGVTFAQNQPVGSWQKHVTFSSGHKDHTVRVSESFAGH